MKCPICDDVTLREVEKEGVLIDVCPSCKGIWLDRGELEKLRKEFQEDYSHSANSTGYYDRGHDPRKSGREYRESYPPIHDNRGHVGPYDKHGYNPHGYDKYGRRKKKKSVMDVFGDLFD